MQSYNIMFVLFNGFDCNMTSEVAHLVTECGVIQRVQFVGDVFANEVPEHLIEESV